MNLLRQPTRYNGSKSCGCQPQTLRVTDLHGRIQKQHAGVLRGYIRISTSILDTFDTMACRFVPLLILIGSNAHEIAIPYASVTMRVNNSGAVNENAAANCTIRAGDSVM